PVCHLSPFPTRRSSDLFCIAVGFVIACCLAAVGITVVTGAGAAVFFSVVPPHWDENAQFVPGLTAAGIASKLVGGDFECEGPKPDRKSTRLNSSHQIT